MAEKKETKKSDAIDVPEGVEPPGPGQTLHTRALHSVQAPFEGVLIQPENGSGKKAAKLGGEGQTKEEWDAEHIELIEAVKKAQQDLWDHSHPVIVDPQLVADQEFAEQKKSEKKAASKSATKGPLAKGEPK
jgi:hypothetical protein